MFSVSILKSLSFSVLKELINNFFLLLKISIYIVACSKSYYNAVPLSNFCC
jgi:hypothetical protein